MQITINELANSSSIDEFIKQAAVWAGKAGDSAGADVCSIKVRANLDIAQIRLTQAEQKLRELQIKLSLEANRLNEELLLSNKQASEQSEKSAELMNNATQELARSTKSLKWATWALVTFTAVQALIALAALLKK
jgi:hypothetical protein